ncbi:MAG: sigma 54-interacting transcriptional regulator [Sandaracinaceae bacterium]|nr:sigma 54-interacting transcriptional regulator [Sandaracinaceae bacterium]
MLRALQTGEITRVGGERSIAVDVRMVAATNRDLEADVAEGIPRGPLLPAQRGPAAPPALARAPRDIPALAVSVLREFCRENGLREKAIADDVLEALPSAPLAGQRARAAQRGGAHGHPERRLHRPRRPAQHRAPVA